MTSTFTVNKNYQKQATGDNVNAWGSILNSNVFDIIDSNLGGRLALSVAGSADVTITQAQSANIYHTLSGVLTGNINYIVPNAGGFYFINNSTTGNFSITVKPASGTGIVVPQGQTSMVFINPDTGAASKSFDYATSATPRLTLASATTTDLGSLTSSNLLISGTTTITSFGSSASINAPVYNIMFSGALTLTHNGASLILPGAQNITTAANDYIRAQYLGSGNWIVLEYARSNGQSVSMAGPSTNIASATTTDLGTIVSNSVVITGVTTITSLGSSASTANPIYFIRFTGILTLTYNASSLIIPGAANITTAAGDTATAEYLGSGNWRILNYTKASGSTSAILSVKRQKFTANGTYTPSAGMVEADIEGWGGGGAGGGATAAAGACGAGGGSGAYSRILVTAAQVGASKAVTIGAAGTGGAGTGGNGGDTSVGTLMVAKGGTGGLQGASSANVLGGAGGLASGGTGDVTGNGVPGWPGIGGVGGGESSGAGGMTSLGGNGQSKYYTLEAAGDPAIANTGSGGGGAASNGTAHNGGNGATGFVLITEWCTT